MNYGVKDLQAGNYTLVLKCGGKEPVSFNITLSPDHENGWMVIK